MLPEQLRELPECSAVILFDCGQRDSLVGAEFSFVPAAARTLDVGIVTVSRGPIVVAGEIHGVDGLLETVSVELDEANEPWHGIHSTATEWSSTGFSIRGWPVYHSANAKGQPLQPTLNVRAHGFEPVTIPFKLGTTNLSVTLSPTQR